MPHFPALTFGLARPAEVNGRQLGSLPLAGIRLPPGFSSLLQLPTSIVAFFARRGSQSTVVRRAVPASLRLDFSRRQSAHRLAFQEGRWLAG
jgi:hypothetical protein